jgi:hypothetical protein
MTDAWTHTARQLLKTGMPRDEVARVLSAAKAFGLEPADIAAPTRQHTCGARTLRNPWSGDSEVIEPVSTKQMDAGYNQAASACGLSGLSRARQIINEASRASGFSVKALKGPRQTRGIVHTRQDAMLAIREATKLSLPQIGRLFNRHHTAVLRGLKSAKQRRAEKMGASA